MTPRRLIHRGELLLRQCARCIHPPEPATTAGLGSFRWRAGAAFSISDYPKIIHSKPSATATMARLTPSSTSAQPAASCRGPNLTLSRAAAMPSPTAAPRGLAMTPALPARAGRLPPPLAGRRLIHARPT